MGLRLKILSGFLILALMLSTAGIWSMVHFRLIGASVQHLMDDNYRSINASKTMLEALERVDSAILQLLQGKWQEGRQAIESADSLFAAAYQVARSNPTEPDEQSYVDRIGVAYEEYKRLWERPIVGTDRENSLDWYSGSTRGAYQEVKAAVNDLMALNGAVLYITASDLKNRANRAAMPGLVAIITALIFSLIFSYFVNYYVVNPIIKVTEGINRFTKTGESLDIRVTTRDELAQLITSLQYLISKFSKDNTAS